MVVQAVAEELPFGDKVFDAAREKLSTIQKRADYGEVAAQLVRESLNQLKVSQASVRADEATSKYLSKTLDQIAKDAASQVTVGDPLEEGTGVLVASADGRVQYDNTLETRLERLQSALRSAVYQVLMGEKL